MAKKRRTPPASISPAMRAWPASKIEMWPLENIHEHPGNPRLHDDAQVRKIADSMQRFGVTAPVLVDEAGVLIYGHGRKRGAALLGYTHLPVAMAVGWTDDEKRAYRIADNQLTELSTWDMPALRLDLAALQGAGFDMPLLGFDPGELGDMLRPEGLTDPDDVPEPPKTPVSKLGDLWLLGVYYECKCGEKNELQVVRDGVHSATLQSEVLQRRVPEDTAAAGLGSLQENSQGNGKGTAVAEKSGKGKNRPCISADREGQAHGRRADNEATAATLLPNEEASWADGSVSEPQGSADSGDGALRLLRNNGRSDGGSHPFAIPGWQTSGGQPPSSVSGMQCEQGPGNHPLCQRCGAQLGLEHRRSRHKILCGDSTKAEDVSRLLGDVKPHLMVTDPPYGVSYDPAWRNATNFSPNRATGTVANDDTADWSGAWALFPGDVAYVWHGALHATVVADNLVASGFVLRGQIIWAKQNQVFSRGDYHWKHEPCWYAVRKGKTGHWSGDRKQTTLWEVANHNPMGGNTDEKSTGHSTQKPVECMKRPIENNSQAGDSVYDPFVGVFTTGIACEMTVRRCLAIEIDPAYVDVCVARWQKFTGENGVLDGDGRDFEAVAAERLAAAV